jgi:trigger factor
MGGLEKLARFEVPRALVEVEANALMESARKQAAEFNKGNDKPELNAEEFAPLARKRVGLSLIIERLVSQHNLQAKPEQLRQIVERIASAYEKPAEMIRHCLSDRERMANVGRIAIEDNVVDFVLARARVAPRKIPLKALLLEAHHS